MEIKQILNRIPRQSCLNCGSLWTLAGILCEPCELRLQRDQPSDLLQTSYEFGDVFSLYDWSPGESDMLSRLILQLKGAHQEKAWAYYAYLFVTRRLSRGLKVQRIHIVVPPYLATRKHALFWGRGLSQRLGADLQSPLMTSQAHHQKGLNLEGRALRSFSVSEEFTQNQGETRGDLWVFADDVFTSGSTARAAYKALGSPPHFEVWCLGQRGALLRSLTGSAIKAE